MSNNAKGVVEFPAQGNALGKNMEDQVTLKEFVSVSVPAVASSLGEVHQKS